MSNSTLSLDATPLRPPISITVTNTSNDPKTKYILHLPQASGEALIQPILISSSVPLGCIRSHIAQIPETCYFTRFSFAFKSSPVESTSEWTIFSSIGELEPLSLPPDSHITIKTLNYDQTSSRDHLLRTIFLIQNPVQLPDHYPDLPITPISTYPLIFPETIQDQKTTFSRFCKTGLSLPSQHDPHLDSSIFESIPHFSLKSIKSIEFYQPPVSNQQHLGFFYLKVQVWDVVPALQHFSDLSDSIHTQSRKNKRKNKLNSNIHEEKPISLILCCWEHGFYLTQSVGDKFVSRIYRKGSIDQWNSFNLIDLLISISPSFKTYWDSRISLFVPSNIPSKRHLQLSINYLGNIRYSAPHQWLKLYSLNPNASVTSSIPLAYRLSTTSQENIRAANFFPGNQRNTRLPGADIMVSGYTSPAESKSSRFIGIGAFNTTPLSLVQFTQESSAPGSNIPLVAPTPVSLTTPEIRDWNEEFQRLIAFPAVGADQIENRSLLQNRFQIDFEIASRNAIVSVFQGKASPFIGLTHSEIGFPKNKTIDNKFTISPTRDLLYLRTELSHPLYLFSNIKCHSSIDYGLGHPFVARLDNQLSKFLKTKKDSFAAKYGLSTLSSFETFIGSSSFDRMYKSIIIHDWCNMFSYSSFDSTQQLNQLITASVAKQVHSHEKYKKLQKDFDNLQIKIDQLQNQFKLLVSRQEQLSKTAPSKNYSVEKIQDDIRLIRNAQTKLGTKIEQQYADYQSLSIAASNIYSELWLEFSSQFTVSPLSIVEYAGYLWTCRPIIRGQLNQFSPAPQHDPQHAKLRFGSVRCIVPYDPFLSKSADDENIPSAPIQHESIFEADSHLAQSIDHLASTALWKPAKLEFLGNKVESGLHYGYYLVQHQDQRTYFNDQGFTTPRDHVFASSPDDIEYLPLRYSPILLDAYVKECRSSNARQQLIQSQEVEEEDDSALILTQAIVDKHFDSLLLEYPKALSKPETLPQDASQAEKIKYSQSLSRFHRNSQKVKIAIQQSLQQRRLNSIQVLRNSAPAPQFNINSCSPECHEVDPNCLGVGAFLLNIVLPRFVKRISQTSSFPLDSEHLCHQMSLFGIPPAYLGRIASLISPQSNSLKLAFPGESQIAQAIGSGKLPTWIQMKPFDTTGHYDSNYQSLFNLCILEIASRTTHFCLKMHLLHEKPTPAFIAGFLSTCLDHFLEPVNLCSSSQPAESKSSSKSQKSKAAQHLFKHFIHEPFRVEILGSFFPVILDLIALHKFRFPLHLVQGKFSKVAFIRRVCVLSGLQVCSNVPLFLTDSVNPDAIIGFVPITPKTYCQQTSFHIPLSSTKITQAPDILTLDHFLTQVNSSIDKSASDQIILSKDILKPFDLPSPLPVHQIFNSKYKIQRSIALFTLSSLAQTSFDGPSISTTFNGSIVKMVDEMKRLISSSSMTTLPENFRLASLQRAVQLFAHIQLSIQRVDGEISPLLVSIAPELSTSLLQIAQLTPVPKSSSLLPPNNLTIPSKPVDMTLPQAKQLDIELAKWYKYSNQQLGEETALLSQFLHKSCVDQQAFEVEALELFTTVLISSERLSGFDNHLYLSALYDFVELVLSLIDNCCNRIESILVYLEKMKEFGRLTTSIAGSAHLFGSSSQTATSIKSFPLPQMKPVSYVTQQAIAVKNSLISNCVSFFSKALVACKRLTHLINSEKIHPRFFSIYIRLAISLNKSQQYFIGSNWNSIFDSRIIQPKSITKTGVNDLAVIEPIESLVLSLANDALKFAQSFGEKAASIADAHFFLARVVLFDSPRCSKISSLIQRANLNNYQNIGPAEVVKMTLIDQIDKVNQFLPGPYKSGFHHLHQAGTIYLEVYGPKHEKTLTCSTILLKFHSFCNSVLISLTAQEEMKKNPQKAQLKAQQEFYSKSINHIASNTGMDVQKAKRFLDMKTKHILKVIASNQNSETNKNLFQLYSQKPWMLVEKATVDIIREVLRRKNLKKTKSSKDPISSNNSESTEAPINTSESTHKDEATISTSESTNKSSVSIDSFETPSDNTNVIISKKNPIPL